MLLGAHEKREVGYDACQCIGMACKHVHVLRVGIRYHEVGGAGGEAERVGGKVSDPLSVHKNRVIRPMEMMSRSGAVKVVQTRRGIDCLVERADLLWKSGRGIGT